MIIRYNCNPRHDAPKLSTIFSSFLIFVFFILDKLMSPLHVKWKAEIKREKAERYADTNTALVVSTLPAYKMPLHFEGPYHKKGREHTTYWWHRDLVSRFNWNIAILLSLYEIKYEVSLLEHSARAKMRTVARRMVNNWSCVRKAAVRKQSPLKLTCTRCLQQLTRFWRSLDDGQAVKCSEVL